MRNSEGNRAKTNPSFLYRKERKDCLKKVYPAIIHEEDGYWVEFPDPSGCFTNGDTLEETTGLCFH